MTASSFTVVADPSGRVLHLVVIGDIGLPDPGQVRDTLVDVGLGDSAAPLIVDLRRATLASHDDALDTLRDRVTRWATRGLARRRVALVAAPDQALAATHDIADLLTAYGYRSQVFDTPAAARDWVDGPL